MLYEFRSTTNKNPFKFLVQFILINISLSLALIIDMFSLGIADEQFQIILNTQKTLFFTIVVFIRFSPAHYFDNF